MNNVIDFPNAPGNAPDVPDMEPQAEIFSILLSDDADRIPTALLKALATGCYEPEEMVWRLNIALAALDLLEGAGQ